MKMRVIHPNQGKILKTRRTQRNRPQKVANPSGSRTAYNTTSRRSAVTGLKKLIATAMNEWVSRLGGMEELRTKMVRAGLLGDRMNARSMAELYTCEGPSLLGMY